MSAPLSTHVLDATAGRPAAGMTVRLERRDPTGWATLAESVTGPDGRLAGWVPAAGFGAGDYRLSFGTGAWFGGQGRSAFYPEVVVVFTVTDPAEHHHVPLLLSPYGYSTYRGS
ncbi:MAG: 5-hydroxyisourate hydrolase [Mycobacteriales bacterium]